LGVSKAFGESRVYCDFLPHTFLFAGRQGVSMGRHQLDEVAGPSQRHQATQVLLDGQLTYYHRRFVASMTSRTVPTVLQKFVGQKTMFSCPEVEVLEERWDAREETDAFDTIFFRVSEERFDKQATCSLSPDSRADNNRAKFGKMRAIIVKGRTTDEVTCGRFDDCERVDVPADFLVRTMEKRSVVRMTIYQAIYGTGILQSSSASSHR
jgi:hypothetical protein